MVTSFTPDETEKTPTKALPLTLRALAPGPVMASFFVMVIVPLVRRMGEHAVTAEAKVMVFPEVAAATSARNEPGPESLQFVTENVAAVATWPGSMATETVASPTSRRRQ
jgi:hypothetical protein